MSPRWESSRLPPRTLQQDPGVAIAGETLPRADHVCARGGAQASARGWWGARRRGPGGGGEGGIRERPGYGRGREHGAPGRKRLCCARGPAAQPPARPPRPASDPPSVDAAAGAAAHSPRKGSEGPPEKFPNDRSRSAANSSFLFWALFPLPLSLSFLEKLAS